MSGKTATEPPTTKKRSTRNSNKPDLDDIVQDSTNKEIYYDKSKKLDEVSVNVDFQENNNKKRTKQAMNTDEDIFPRTEIPTTLSNSSTTPLEHPSTALPSNTAATDSTKTTT